MENIIPFVKDENNTDSEIWCCDCGCITFKLYSDGKVVCAQCETESSELVGFYRPKENKAGETADIVKFAKD